MNTHNEQLTRREFLKTAAAFAGLPLIANAGEAARPRGSRISYHCNGEIHVGVPGQPEGKPLTTGHWDAKPSWSKTGDMLVCFRRLKADRVTANWKTAAFIVNVDGTGFHVLSDGTRTDFNPTWTRDGLNTPVWNRKNDKTGGYYVMQSKVGNKPGQETAVTDESFSTWVHSALTDGRLLVTAFHPTLGRGYFLLVRREGAKPVYEPIQFELAKRGFLDRISVSPSEKKICFEYQTGFKSKGMGGRTLYIADFDVQKRAITNPKPFANEAGKPSWFAYPRWIDGESAVVYHSGETGRNQLYVYRLDNGSTKRVSTNAKADYRYPHGEAAPC
jgi:Tol biopolymer transport system component